MMVQLYDLKMTNSRLEAELLEEGEKRQRAQEEGKALTQTQKRLDASLRRAEQRAADAEGSHASTLSKLFQLVDANAPMAEIAEAVRRRDKQLQKDQERAGRPRRERPEPDDSDEALVREMMHQRDKMQVCTTRGLGDGTQQSPRHPPPSEPPPK